MSLPVSPGSSPARRNARAQASTVAPEVSTSSTMTSFLPLMSMRASLGAAKAPSTLRARSARASPTWGGVARVRMST